MRLAAFRRTDEAEGTRRTGLVVGDGPQWFIHPFPEGTDLVELLAADAADREAEADAAAQGDGLQPEEVVLLPPVYPVAMRDFLTFEAHVDGMERGHGNPGPPEEWYDAPVFLFMAPHAVTGAHDDVAMPPETERLDFELEIAAIVCRDVRNVTPERARSAIGGYCVMNDWSARDVQGKEMRLKLGPSKGKDFATTIGPWVVTPDELESHRDGDRLDLSLQASINGAPLGDPDTLRSMAWSFEELLAFSAHGASIQAGDVIGCGTCANGCLMELWGRNQSWTTPPPLRPGDVVTLEVEGIGTLTNTIVRQDLPDLGLGPARA